MSNDNTGKFNLNEHTHLVWQIPPSGYCSRQEELWRWFIAHGAENKRIAEERIQFLLNRGEHPQSNFMRLLNETLQEAIDLIKENQRKIAALRAGKIVMCIIQSVLTLHIRRSRIQSKWWKTFNIILLAIPDNWNSCVALCTYRLQVRIKNRLTILIILFILLSLLLLC